MMRPVFRGAGEKNYIFGNNAVIRKNGGTPSGSAIDYLPECPYYSLQ
jgi:hypothetical protein